MAEIINTSTLKEHSLDDSRLLWVYNGLDCCVTYEVHEQLKPQLAQSPEAQLAYNFSCASQAPALDMMLRGLRVDENERRRMILKYQEQETQLRDSLNQLVEAALGWSLDARGWRMNPNSPKVMAWFFYEILHLPEIKHYSRGEMRRTTNRKAMEKFQSHPEAGIFARFVLAVRDVKKKLGVLRSGVDYDQRMRFSYHIAGTETFRWSSTKNIYNRATNAQNITNEIRRIFVADPGKKFAYLDLSSAESRVLGYVSGDEAYIKACESGRLHTNVAKMVWPNIGWTDDPVHNDKIAKQIYYRIFSYYDTSKRLGHGTNYDGTAETMARETQIDKSIVVDFQIKYFGAFPGIRAYHESVATELQLTGCLTTPLGVKRRFMGRRSDKATLREAIAFVPQCTVGMLLNLAMWHVWKHTPPHIELMGQLHDAILIQYPEELEARVIREVLQLMTIPVKVGTRTMTIPIDAKVGWNWEELKSTKSREQNPDGLIAYSGHDSRTRTFAAEQKLEDLIFI